MSSNLGNEYTGANVDFINDSTQDALDLKANLDGGNVFGGVAGSLNRFNTNVFIDPDNLIQAKNIWGFYGLTLNTTIGDNINFNPAANSKVTSTGSIDLVAGKEYLIDGVNILDAKANLAGGNTFTGDQIVDNIIVGGDIKGVNNQDLNISSNTNGVNVTAVTIKANGETEMDGKTTFKQAIVGGNSQSLTAGSPVIDHLRLITKLDTTAGNITATINNGTHDGQIKILNLHKADPQYSATITANVSETITLKNVGEGAILVWSGNTADWNVIAKNQHFLTELKSVNDIEVRGDIKGIQNQDLNISSNTNGVNVTAVTIKPNGETHMDGKTTFKQGIIGGNSQSLTAGSPVIDHLRLITKLDTTAGNITATISNGTHDGQIKILNLHKADPQYTATITANVSERITLKNVGEGAILVWSGNTADWNVVAKNQKYLTELLSVNDIEVRGDIKGIQNQDLNISSNTNGTPIDAVTIKANGETHMDGKTTFKQSIIGGNSQSHDAGTRVIDSTRLITKLDTRAGNITATISNGTADGQIKIINLHRADATQYKATLSVNVSEAITLKNVGEGVILAWSANTADWSVIAKNVSFINNQLNMKYSNVPLGTSTANKSPPTGSSSGDVYRDGANGLFIVP